MSDAAQSTTQKVENTLSNVAAALSAALPTVEAIGTALAPEAAGAIATAVAIAKGVMAGVPEAVSLWNQFQAGTIPTQAELDSYMAQENTAYNQVMADIAAKLNAAS